MSMRSDTIAIVTSDLEYFNASVCAGLYDAFFSKGYKVTIYLTHEQENVEKEIVSKLMSQPSIKGMVIFSSCSTSFYYQENLKDKTVPCVFVDRLLPYLSCNFVTVDNYGGGLKLGKLLIEKGCKKIACVSMLKDNKLTTVEDRLNGFRDSHFEMHHVSCFREEVDYFNLLQSTKTLLEKWFDTKDIPNGIFAVNHLILKAFLDNIFKDKAMEKSLEHTILSCFDDLPYFDWIKKPIISIEQPINDIVFYTDSILLKRIENPYLANQFANMILPVKIKDRTENAK